MLKSWMYLIGYLPRMVLELHIRTYGGRYRNVIHCRVMGVRCRGNNHAFSDSLAVPLALRTLP